jgi:hypothetical protein
MPTLARAWTAPSPAARLATAHPATATARAFFTQLLMLPQKLGHTLARRTRVPASVRRPWAPQPRCSYAMLVPGDIRPEVADLLP